MPSAPVAASLRIVHCFRAPVGGVFRHVRDLARAQAAAGHHVGIICDSSEGDVLQDRQFDDVRDILDLGIHRVPIRRRIGIGDIAAGWRTYRLIKELRPDVLHGHGAKGGALARVFGSLLRVFRYRVARLYSPHGGVLHYDPATAKGKALFAIERTLSRMTDRVLFVSDYERRTFLAKVGAPACPTELIYNGLADAEFAPVPADPGAADFLYIGEMRDLKGPDLFIKALAQASEALGRPLDAVMVGAGPDLPRYEQQARDAGLADRIRFLPPMPARRAFALARMIVVPSRAEAMPYIVLEALAAGKPMIASTVGGIVEIFAAGSPALVAPGAEAIAAAMISAMGDPEAFAAAMPRRDDLKARFGVKTMAQKVESAYRDSLDR